jgi:hypothetical protein
VAGSLDAAGRIFCQLDGVKKIFENFPDSLLITIARCRIIVIVRTWQASASRNKTGEIKMTINEKIQVLASHFTWDAKSANVTRDENGWHVGVTLTSENGRSVVPNFISFDSVDDAVTCSRLMKFNLWK